MTTEQRQISADELNRRLRRARFISYGGFALTLLLIAVSYLFGQRLTTEKAAPQLTSILWGLLLGLAIAAFIWRRTRYSTLRIKNVETLGGGRGLIDFLERTSVTLALGGIVIAVIGFIAALFSSDFIDAVRGTLVSLIVLVISLPRTYLWRKALRSD